MTSVIQSSISAGDTVVVLGLGLIGNLAGQLYGLRGAKVIGVDTIPERLDTALRCGFDYVVPAMQTSELLKEIEQRTGSNVELASTILELAGCLDLSDHDGFFWVPILTKPELSMEKSPWNEGYAEFHGSRFFYTQRIVWYDRYKYIFNGFDIDELYDLSIDPQERNNLADVDDYREIVESMAIRM